MQRRPGLDHLALRDEQAGAPRELVLLLRQRLAVLVHALGEDRDLRPAVGVLDVDPAGDLRERRRALRVPRLEDLDDAREAVRDVRAGDAAGVERPHRQLRARLADRLRGDDADRVADLGGTARGEERPVAGAAHAELAAALEHRAHGDAEVLRRLLEPLGDLAEPRERHLLAGLGQHRLAGLSVLERLAQVGGEEPAGDALVEAVRQDQRELDELRRAAVEVADDHVLRDVDETPRQVARVRRAERRVREALAGAVGRDEVLEHRQALHEVGLDRALDDLALRVRHEAAHARELADLLERSARPGVGHHEDRVQLVERPLHRVCDGVGGLRPDRHDLLVALLVGDEAALVLLRDLPDPLLVLGEDLLLVRRDDDVVLRHRDAGLRREAEAEALDRVEDPRHRRRAVAVDELRDEAVRLALRQRAVDVVVERGRVDVLRAERLPQGAVDLRVEDDTARGREHELVAPAVLDRLPESDLLALERELDLLLGAEALRPRLRCPRRTSP